MIWYLDDFVICCPCLFLRLFQFQSTHAYILGQEPKKRMGYYGHWLFAIRGVMINKIFKAVEKRDDSYLLAGCCLCFGYAIQQTNKLLNDKLLQDMISEKTARENAQKQTEKRQKKAKEQAEQEKKETEDRRKSTEIRIKSWLRTDVEEPTRSLDAAERVLRHLVKASIAVVDVEPVLSDLFKSNLENIHNVLYDRKKQEPKTRKSF